MKRNEQSLQEIWDYVKRPNLHLIGIPECDRKNESKAGKHSSGYYPRELPQPSKASHHTSPGNTDNMTKIFCKKSNPKAYNHQIEMKEKMVRAAREKEGLLTKGSPSESQQASLQKLHKPEDSGDQYSTSLKKRMFSEEFHIQQN